MTPFARILLLTYAEDYSLYLYIGMRAFFLVLASPICCLAFISSLTPITTYIQPASDKDFVALYGDYDHEQVLLDALHV